jgi:MFS family permease
VQSSSERAAPHPAQPELSVFERGGVYLISLLGATGLAFQNTIAVMQLLQSIGRGALVATRLGVAFVHTLSIVLGGLCSGLVNFCVNIGLLENFFKRLKAKKDRSTFTRWQQVQYWLGSAVFVVTGALFGMTAFAFGSVGALAIAGAVAGIFFAVIMTIQELETWLKGFDALKKEQEKKMISEQLKTWWASLTKAKLLSLVISVGNVIALSFLFTVGMSAFLMGVGVPALPALIVGLVVAFTGGAFTEFYFYSGFLCDFCTNFKNKWKVFKETAYPVLGLIAGILNAAVNGVLSYVGVMLLTSFLVVAGVGCPPLGVMIGIAVTAAVFASAASFILGLDFWIDNSQKIMGYFVSAQKKTEPASEEPRALDVPVLSATPSTSDQSSTPVSLVSSTSSTVTLLAAMPVKEAEPDTSNVVSFTPHTPTPLSVASFSACHEESLRVCPPFRLQGAS